MSISVIVSLLTFHWLGDFVCQSDYFAKHKSHSLVALGGHCLTYAAVMACCAISLKANIGEIISFAALMGLSHFLIDFFTSRINYAIWSKFGYSRLFFNVVGFDQLLHFLTIVWFWEIR